MKAAVLHSRERKVRIEDIPRPEVTDGQVRVQIKACGVCGSDVHLVIHGTMSAKTFPVIPGHEASGVVLETGAGASRFETGARVVIAPGTSCGTCAACTSGRMNLCAHVGVFGFDCNGAFAEEVVVPERYLFGLPDGIPFDRGAILADAVSTPYHALRYAGQFESGQTVAVIGCGGLGIHAVLIARALGSPRVFALDVHDGALENAHKAGATDLLSLAGARNPGKLLREKSGGVDMVLDFSGHYETVETMFRALNTGGRIVLVGLGKGTLSVGPAPIMIFKQMCVRGSYGSDARAVPELIALVESGRLDLTGSISGKHKLEDVNDCLHNLDVRNGNPIRYIIEPNR